MKNITVYEDYISNLFSASIRKSALCVLLNDIFETIRKLDPGNHIGKNIVEYYRLL